MPLFGGEWLESNDDDDRSLCFGGDWHDNTMDDDDICFAISPSMRESIEAEKEKNK